MPFRKVKSIWKYYITGNFNQTCCSLSVQYGIAKRYANPDLGKAINGTKIRVSLGKISKETKANADNEWILTFSPLSYSKETLVFNINDDYSFKNILVGEVWLCTGQSNMVFQLSRSNNYDLILQKDYSQPVRLLNYQGIRNVAKDGFTNDELKRCNVNDYFQGKWVGNSKENAKDFSAVGWYFGNYISSSLIVPVGLVSVAIGGSAINNWIPTDVLQNSSFTRNLFLKDWLTNPDVQIGHRERAKQAFQNVIKPNEPYMVGKMPYRWICEPGFIFDAGLAPLKYLSFRGVIWYQGENDAGNMNSCNNYKELFPLMVSSWRNYFSNGNFPFLFVQLPGFKNEYWPNFREIQKELNQTVPNTKMAVTIDLGEENSVHPLDKEPVGLRLSKLAEHYVYGENVLADSPEIEYIKSNRKSIILSFKNTGSGFQKINGRILGFEIADQTGKFQAVDAKLLNKSSVKINHNINNPSKIRYAWKPFPQPLIRLFNSAGIPLGPFILNI